jgi:hypothetical protein
LAGTSAPPRQPLDTPVQRSQERSLPGVPDRCPTRRRWVDGLARDLGDLGALLIAAFTLRTAFLIHHFWTDQEPMSRQMTQFIKDIALTGGALILFVLYSIFGGELDYQIVDPLFSLTP